MRTHSVARVRALEVTSRGCTTFSSSRLVMVPWGRGGRRAKGYQFIFDFWSLLACTTNGAP